MQHVEEEDEKVEDDEEQDEEEEAAKAEEEELWNINSSIFAHYLQACGSLWYAWTTCYDLLLKIQTCEMIPVSTMRGR